MINDMYDDDYDPLDHVILPTDKSKIIRGGCCHEEHRKYGYTMQEITKDGVVVWEQHVTPQDLADLDSGRKHYYDVFPPRTHDFELFAEYRQIHGHESYEEIEYNEYLQWKKQREEPQPTPAQAGQTGHAGQA